MVTAVKVATAEADRVEGSLALHEKDRDASG